MGKIFELINRDTKQKNESKRMTVLIRQLLLMFIALSLFHLFIDISLLKSLQGALVWVAMLVVDAVTLWASYNTSKRFILAIFIIQKTGWIISSTLVFGWESGFQYFIILLMIVYSFGEAGYTKKKLFFDFFCFTLIVVFLEFLKGEGGRISIENADKSIQVFNALAFVAMVAIVSISFSKESQQMEDKLITYNNQLKEQASVDALTGLYNRRSTMEFINRLINEKRVFSICIGDIDFFKKVNDTYGHDFGDTVLVAISEVMRNQVLSYGLVSRWGGEEFLIIFVDQNGDEAYVNLSHVRDTVKAIKLNHIKDEVTVTMTYGLTEYDTSKSFEENIKDADEKLYMGKQTGRDKIVY